MTLTAVPMPLSVNLWLLAGVLFLAGFSISPSVITGFMRGSLDRVRGGRHRVGHQPAGMLRSLPNAARRQRDAR